MSRKYEVNDYKVEYSKSGRASCKLTREKIPKGALRIGRMFDGTYPLWYCFDDFEENERKVEEFRSKCKKIHGLSDLRLEDQKRINTLLKGDDDDDDEMVDEGEEGEEKGEYDEEKANFEKENKLIWEMKDKLSSNCKNKVIRDMLELNEQDRSGGTDTIIERCAHGMIFGALGKCGRKDCTENSFLNFSGPNVVCSGKNAWGKCSYKISAKDAVTTDWKVQENTRNEFLNEFEFKKHTKSTYQINAVVNVDLDKMEDEGEEDKEEFKVEKGKPFKGMTFYFAGRLENTQKELREFVEGAGGNVTKSESKWDEKLTFFVTNKKTFDDNGVKIRRAKKMNVTIVDEEMVHMIIEKEEMLTEKEIEDAGYFFLKGTTHVNNVGRKKRKRSDVGFEESTRKKKVVKRTLKIKGHSAVDFDVWNGENYHVLEKSANEIYSVHLTCVDVTANINSFYILQIVVHDKDDSDIKLFRKWGRVGTDIGSSKEQHVDDEEDAIWQFEKIYLDKTGNHWKDRANFEKKPGKFFPIKIDYGEKVESLKNRKEEYKGKLSKEVRELIELIFDVDLMETTLKSMDIDIEKMPLGKLSKETITNGFLVLQDLQTMIEQAERNPNIDYKDEFMKYSNKFYTYIPHTFTGSKIPLINNLELLRKKVSMLETLRDMEVATNLLQLSKKDKVDPVDQYYQKLKSDITAITKDSKEFDVIQKFISNTHCPTHTSYTLELLEAFKLERHGEMDRFDKWKDDENRRLLWHGSRLSNWVGIISQGLRIAPPEAPVTGYMFGKGVYFADMVSKSANYCRATRENPISCMLLADVSLGKMYERLQAEFVTKEFMDEKGFQSTWGKGKTIPDPNKKYVHNIDGSKAVVGKPKTVNIRGSSLLYNEFIVYDVSQINMKYLLKVKFKFKKNTFWW